MVTTEMLAQGETLELTKTAPSHEILAKSEILAVIAHCTTYHHHGMA
jgi:hypothetical protein